LKRIVKIVLPFALVGCSTGEKPDLSFFLSTEWKMTKVFVDGEEVDIDKSLYRLKIEQNKTVTRINFDGSEAQGVWDFTNGFNQLILFADTPFAEQYLILELQIRRLELQAVQSDNKVGSTEFRYVLEPTRP